MDLHAVAVNPSVSKLLFNYAIIGFALTEAIALFTIMVVFLILFYNQIFKFFFVYFLIAIMFFFG